MKKIILIFALMFGSLFANDMLNNVCSKNGILDEMDCVNLVQGFIRIEKTDINTASDRELCDIVGNFAPTLYKLRTKPEIYNQLLQEMLNGMNEESNTSMTLTPLKANLLDGMLVGFLQAYEKSCK